MATTIDRAELHARLDEFLARAASGERILVRDAAGHVAALGPADDERPASPGPARRRRHRASQTIEAVLAEDRGT